jgi:peptidoglycan/xylan/chitin deacetylase (PgdA/CDA1 family)
MKFIIRDDDINHFSTRAMIERWYADIFASDIPVGFSAIPFIVPSGDTYPEDIPESPDEHPIRGNKELIAYVKGNPLIEILQHGTTHETVNGVYEYQNPRIAREEAIRGHAELEQAFGASVRVFVPPHDWIGASGVRAVERAGMDIIRGRGAGLRNFIPRWRYLINFFIALGHKLTHLGMPQTPAYPYVLDFGKHREVCSYRLEDSDVFEGLAYAHRKDGVFVVVTHLHFYTPEKKQRLLDLIAKGRELDAEFVAPSALFS